MQPDSLLARAGKVLQRNQERNWSATGEKTDFEKLLKRVGAFIRHDEEGVTLVFDPPLDGPWHDLKRWILADELEEEFFKQDFKGGG